MDRVLVDAPCSGVGSWRRKPDSRWLPPAKTLDELNTLQGDILARASKLVKPGGRLVYATCSLLTSENEEQVKCFLESEEGRMGGWHLGKPESSFGGPLDADGCMRLSPARTDTDGFFAAVLVRGT